MAGSLWIDLGLFVMAAGLILVVGPRLSRSAEQLAGVTGTAQTLAGALFLGASTSLPGMIVSLQTAVNGRATIPLANSLGGIAAQTMFIALADVALRRDTITHEDRLTASLMQSAVLITLLALVSFATFVPRAFVVLNVHPASPIIAIGVVLGFKVIQESRRRPQWLTTDRAREYGRDQEGEHGSDDRSRPSETDVTDGRNAQDESQHAGSDEQPQSDSSSTVTIVGRYLLYLVLVGIGGVTVSTAGTGIIEQTGLSPLLVGLTGMAIATSLPELVTAVSAVRRGSVALAIGDIVAGNAFDTIMVAGADFVYRDGPIYAATIPEVAFLVTLVVLMTGILLIGFLRREQHDLARIGLESYLVAVTYGAGIGLILLRKVSAPWG